MERSFASDARGDRAGPRDLPVGTARLRRGGRSICRGSVSHIVGDLYLYTLSDSRSVDRVMAYTGLLFFPAGARGRTALALCVLGIRVDLRVECSNEGPDRTGFSSGSHRAFSPADEKCAVAPEAPPCFQFAGVLGDRRAVAHPRGDKESRARPGAEFSLVVLHQ